MIKFFDLEKRNYYIVGVGSTFATGIRKNSIGLLEAFAFYYDCRVEDATASLGEIKDISLCTINSDEFNEARKGNIDCMNEAYVDMTDEN